MTTIERPNTKKLRFTGSIQGQLIFWFLILGLIPPIIMGVASWMSSRNAIIENVREELAAIAHAKTSRIDDWLIDSQLITQTIAELSAISGDTNASTTLGLEDIIRYRNDSENRELYLTAYNEALKTINAYVENFRRVDGAVLISTDGTVQVSSLDSIPEGSDISRINWLDIDLTSNETRLHPVVNVDDKGILTVTTPIKGSNGRTTGALAVIINMDRVNAVLTDFTGFGETGETYIVNLGNSTMLTDSRFDEDTAFKQVIQSFAIDSINEGTTSGTSDYVDYRNHHVVGAWETIPAMNWAIIAEEDYDAATSAVNELGIVIFTIVTIAALVIVSMTYMIARSIALPIGNLTSSATRLANGNLQERSDVISSNEVGLLASAFNQMASNLQGMVEAERDSKAELERVINEYSIFIEEVANGNLAISLDVSSDSGEYEDLTKLGKNLNNMVASLRTMANQISETAIGISAAAAEILAATTQQIASATEQEAAVTQTMTTVEEVRTTVKQTSDRAQQVAEASKQSVNISLNGQESVSNSIDGMKLIRQRVESIAENILMLSERTQQIGEIIDTVNEIAAQSKLLALNASIEAARAGEEGKGFAVVAMEVRQLAEQSRDATSRVRDILNQIQQATNTAVMVTEEGSKGAESGMTLVERAGESISALTRTIEDSAQAAIQIAASTNQQNNGMEQLAGAMSSIKQATAQTAASTRQAERSAKDLNDMAKQMQSASARYRLN